MLVASYKIGITDRFDPKTGEIRDLELRLEIIEHPETEEEAMDRYGASTAICAIFKLLVVNLDQVLSGASKDSVLIESPSETLN